MKLILFMKLPWNSLHRIHKTIVSILKVTRPFLDDRINSVTCYLRSSLLKSSRVLKFLENVIARMIVRSIQRYISGKVEMIAQLRRGTPCGVTSRRCVEARPMNARRRRTGRKVRRDHGSDLKNSRKRGKKTVEEGRERGEETRERARNRQEGHRIQRTSATRIERILTPILRLVSSFASLSSFREVFRHACKFLKLDTFSCGTFER